jgi:VCBS repeat-containing protein
MANGLKVELYEGINFNTLRNTRTEASINFYDAYDTSYGGNGDTFSIRATGQIQAYQTGTNTFKVGSDDGVRVWINNALVVDSWRDRGIAFDSFSFVGTQGSWYDIKIEYYESIGGAALILRNNDNTLVTALRSVQNNAIAGTYGNLTLDPSGSYLYSLNQTANNVQSLQAGDNLSETFFVTVSDGQGGSVEQQLNISISGSNDQPQITTAIADPTFTEFTSASSQTLIASGTLAFNDVDAADSANAAVILKNPANWNGGTLNASLKAALEAGFTLTTATSGLTSPGSVGWAYNASNLNLDFLAQGQSITLTYTVNITDPRGGIGSDDVTITIYGSNDGPVVTNGPTELLGAVTEAGHLPNGTVVVGTPSVSGTLSASDLDSGATRTWSIAGSPSTTYGNLAINASTGVWTYTLENNATATQALAEGQSVTQSYIARVTDNNGATADQTVTITINGTNDKPDIVDPNRSSTATFSSSSEGWSNGKLMTSSQWGSLLGPYGVAESSSKVFSGTSPIQAISFDWFRLDSWDGEQFKIKANGVDIYSGSFHFGTIPTANSSGTSGGFSWTLAPKEYGNYANAGWQDQRFVFTLTPPANTTNLTLHLSSTLDQASYDEAWGIDNVTITRLSTAVFEGSVLEAGAVDAGTASVSGTLTASDLDTGASLSWSLVGTPSTTYGSIAIDASTGVWTYTLKNDATATQALAEGQSVTQSYIARVTDEFGTYAEQTVTVTINGSNDQPTVSANTPGVPLGGTDPLPIDALLRVSDPDNTQLASALVRIEDPRTGDRLLWNVDLAQAKGLELTYSTTTAELSISGVALVEDYQAVLRTVAYAVDWGQTSAPAAGSSRSIAIQVVDANYGTRGQASSDLYRTTIQLAQIATSPAPATAQEDNGSVTTTGPLAQLPALHLFNPATSTLSLTGQLALSDSDFGQQLFSPVVREWSPSAGVANGGERAGANLGALTITADGNWIYMLDNTHPFIQALRAGEQRLESFLVQSLDGTARQRIDITIEGCDDHLVQYASQVLRMSSEGKDPDSDVYKRWFASQALGAPNTDFGDIDTAWSPRRRNSEISNGDAFDEYIELGFSRSVRATGARIHETAGLGFVREVWGSYLDDQGVRKYTATPLWVGTDNAAINEAAPGVLELSFAGNTQLIDGLLILVDIDHTDFWEQIDAVELIGIATPESYVPRAPTIDDVAEDNRVNLAEKTAGVMLSGNYDHHTSTHVDVRWGGKTFAAQLNAEQGLWWYTVSAENVPSDLQSSTIEVQSFDRSDARSGDRFASKSVSATVVIDTVAPGRPTLAVVAVDDAINQYEKYATGVTLSGTAEPLSTIEIAWDYKQPRKVQVDANGAWSLDFSAAQIPYDEVNSHILVTAIDAAGNRSLAFDRPVVIDTDAPLKATINPLHWSDSVNAAQKAAGVPVTGSAEIGASVDVSWVQADGSRITRSTTADRAGVIGIAGASTTVTLRFGSTLLGTATSGANGEFLYLFKEADLTLFRQNAADSTLVLTAGWTENGVAVQTSRLQLATGLWQTIFNSSDVPADGNATRLEAVATDAQGNVSRVKTDAVLVDTQAPAAPVIDDWDQNLNAEELADTLLIKGTAELGASLVLRLMGESTTARASTGRWTAQFTPAQLERIRAAFDLAGGMATLTAQAFDSLGNPSALFSQVITVDAALPTVPTFKRASGSFLTAVDRRDGFTLEGTAEPLTTVELTWGTLRRSVIAAADGAWSVRFAPAEIPADTASSLLLAQSVDAVGNRSEIAELALVIDTVAPSLQLLSVGGADSVLSASGGDQLITGLAEPLRPLSLWLSGGGRLQPVLLVEAIADRQGVFTLTLTTTQLAAVGDGIGHKLEVRQTDAAGNSAVSAPFSFALDTEAPTINLTSIGGEDGVISSAAGDSLIRGTAEPGQPVTVRASRSDGASRQLGVVTPDAQGAFSLSLTAATLAALGQGSGFTLSLSQSDAAGNSTSSNRSFAIDTIAPAAPVIQAAGGLDTTLSTAAGDNTITGLGEAGATVSLWLTDSTGALTNLGTTVSTSAGQFSVGLTAAQLSALPQGGGLILEARITDTAGNTGLSKPFSVSVDTIAPAQPTLTDIGGADRTLTTAAGDAQIQGKASPYSTVELEADVDGVRLALGSTTSTGKGLFSKALTLESLASLGQGVRRFWAVVRDAAGNVARSTALDATVDTVAEQVPYNLSLGGSDAVVSTVSGDQMIRGQAVPGRPVTLSAIVPARGASSSFTLELGTVNPDATGAFTALLSSRHLQDLGQGSGIQLVASQADAVGNLGRSAPLLFEIDTVAPATPKITAVGGADSVITNKITNVLGTAPAGSAVSLWGSNDGSTYSQLTTVTATVDGRFTHALTVAQLAAFQQGSGRLLKASVSDAAGNIATSFPFTFSLETLAPVAPSITSINGEVSGAIRFDVVAKAAGGLKLSGQAPGAAVVELNIEGFTDKPQALPNSDGNWTLLISQDKFPQSKTLTTRSLELTALNRHGDRSAPTKASLRIDTAAPTILNVIQQGDRIRIILDELVQLSSALTTQQFSVRAGISTVAVKAISSLVNGEGNTELVLQLARPLTTNSVVKLNYSGSEITDSLGNPLANFSNRVVSHVLSGSSIGTAGVTPAYNYATFELSGAAHADISANQYDNVLIGNSGDNLLKGGLGADVITGGLGRDTFVYANLRDSVLIDPVTNQWAVDRITDLKIGTDIIDAPNPVPADGLKRVSSASVALERNKLSELLPASLLPANGGAVLSLGSDPASTRTFLVLNDGIAGYNAYFDSLIEITGYTGVLNDLRVI